MEMRPKRLVEEYVAKVEHLCVQESIDAEVLMSNISIETWEDEVLRSMVFRLKLAVAAKEIIKQTHEISYPSDWWQHLKQRWFPMWALRRWPVKLTIETVQERVTKMCPHVVIDKNHRGHLRWLCSDPN
jgi:hypothetical protein